ncbi:MAG TPA: hypothetical protein VK754_00245 [Propionibacteriaceae bacterium]|nr:hypothetical protein [Propionibacteriaceae bacterium]
MKKSVAPSKADIEQALEDTAGAEKVAAKAPTWGDIRDGFKLLPSESKDGSFEASLPLNPETDQGRKNIGLYQEMYAPHWRADAERASEVRGRQPTTVIRRGGGHQTVQERFAEQVERKFHTARASIVVPEMPWKRKQGGG